MADISKVKLPDGSTYDIRDRNAVALTGGTAITSNTDLNTITTAGNYYATSSTIAGSLTNCPIATWFHMRVGYADGVSGSYCYQEIINGLTGQRYYRQKNGGTWTSWHKDLYVNDNNSVYTNTTSAYIGGAGGKPYWKVTIPNIATKWTIITLYFNIQQNYAVGTGGKLIINGYHNATSPYTWSGLTYSTIGYLSNAITVYACDGTTFYIGGLTTGYCNIDLERILVADAARGVDISETTIERVESLPESYATALFRQNQYVSDIGNGTLTTFAYSKEGLGSTSWLAGWNGYELRAISPSNVNAGKVNSHTVNADVPANAKFTDTTYTGTSPISINSSNQVSIATASTSAYGATKLSTATNSTAVDVAATPSAVKTAYDLANTANTTANTALSGVNGNLIYDQTFTISNGVATFTPHVYQKGAEVTTNYAKSCFTWKYRLIDGSEVSLTTNSNRGCTVTISGMGYGGHVIGIFTPS